MKSRLKSHFIIISIIMTLFMTVPMLSCTTQAVSGTEPEAPYLPTTPVIPNTPTVPSSPTEPENPTLPETTEPETPTEMHRVDVVYFHRTNRCHSCTYAEEQIRYTLGQYFSDELRSGMVTFRSVDVQNPDNTEIIEKCGAYTSQLFLITVTNDSENVEHVEEIWKLIGEDEDFSNLVKDKITDALERAA
jgi:hypothetical protein